MKNKWPIYVIVSLLLALMVLFRIYPLYDIVFAESGEVFLLGMDPYFYLRQVQTTLINFPDIQKYDHATHFPAGIFSDASGLYPWSMAGMINLWWGSEANIQQIAGFLAWVPVFFTLLSAILVYRIVTLLRGDIAGIFALFLLLINPGLFLYRGVLGFPDHHILEVFLALWLVWRLVKIEHLPTGLALWGEALKAAIPLVLFFTIWPGAYLYILLSGLLFLILIINTASSSLFTLGRFGLYFFILSAAGYAFLRQSFPDLLTSSFPKYDGIASGIMVMVGILIALSSWIVSLISKKLSPGIYRPVLFFCLVIGTWIFMHYTQVGTEILQRLTFKATGVAENRPVGWVHFFDMFLLSGLISCGYLGYLLVRTFFGKLKHSKDLVFIFLTGFFLFMWMNTYDMGYMIAPFISIVAGCALYDVTVYSIRQEVSRSGWWSKLLQMAPYFIIGISFVLPVLRVSSTYPYKFTREIAQQMVIFPSAWNGTMDWLQEHTPEPLYPVDSIYKKQELDLDHQGHYGILSSWDNGNIINSKGKRIPSWSRWPGPNIEKYLSYPPDSLRHFLLRSQLNYKYIIVDDKMASLYFMSKYQDFAKVSSVNCMDTFALDIEGNVTRVQSYNPCLKSSLIYELYHLGADNLEWVSPVYDSPERVFTGYLINQNHLTLQSINVDQLTSEQAFYIREHEKVITQQGLFFELQERPKIRIFEIHPDRLTSPSEQNE